MTSSTFTCDFCGKTFVKDDPTGEVAKQECLDTFGVLPTSEDGIACTDCYKTVIKGPDDLEARKLYDGYAARN